jgi:DNA-binding response OmpR family regulator
MHNGCQPSRSEKSLTSNCAGCKEQPVHNVHKKPAQSVRPNILCIDDSKHLRALYKHTLQKNGFKVYTSSGGRAALRAVPSHRFALVLVDQRMPGLSGDEVAQKIRRRRPKLPIIMISGNCELQPQAGRTLSAFLPKPIEPEKLVAVVRSFVEK